MAFIEDQNGRAILQKFLDLLHTKPQSKEDVQNLLYKLPELKLRPEKMVDDLISVSKGSSFPYVNPVPSSMAHVSIQQLSKVHIDWKMLTLDRPETILETSIFSRIVFLNKISFECVEREKRRRERMSSFRWKRSLITNFDKEGDSTDEFTYEYYSRFFGSHDRSAQGVEETTKPPPAQQPINKLDQQAIRLPQEQIRDAVPESKKRKVRRKPRKLKIKRKRKKQLIKKKRKKKIHSTEQKGGKRRKRRTVPKTSIQLLKITEKTQRKNKTVKIIK